jgi:hypothetical protein
VAALGIPEMGHYECDVTGISKAHDSEKVMLLLSVKQYGRMKEVKTFKYIFTGGIYDTLIILARLKYFTNRLATVRVTVNTAYTTICY